MDKYIALANLSNGINKGDEFPASRLSPYLIIVLVDKKRIALVEPSPDVDIPAAGKFKKRKYTKRTEE